MKIPLSRIGIDKKILPEIKHVLDSGNFILGKYTSEFEKKFSDFCGTKYSACVSSGTAAIFLALQALNIKKDDEVIIPSLSFVATATPLLMLGAKPKFVDVNRTNYTVDPEEIRKKISRKTKAIIPVHLYGHPANMDEIIEITSKNSIPIIEDAAQAHGAKYKNKMIGNIGEIGCFSFYPSKNLTVCGDGGIVTTNSKKIIDKIKILRNHGREEKYLHKTLGYNFRFNEIQAVIGINMLKKLKTNNEKRRNLAKTYSSKITNKIILPYEEKWAYHVYHMFTIRTKNRDLLKNQLLKNGIETGIHYPIPIHKQPLFKKYSKEKLPITEEICNTTLSLPMFPLLNKKQQKYIITRINNFL